MLSGSMTGRSPCPAPRGAGRCACWRAGCSAGWCFKPGIVFARRPDSDGDGLFDDDETGVYGTDPNNPDTDGDGVDDGQEVFDGTDPLTPNGGGQAPPPPDGGGGA